MDNNTPDFDEVLGQALSGEPRARELLAMQHVLQQRIKGLAQHLAEDEVDKLHAAKVRKKIATLHAQVKALGEEAVIAGFVEDSVKLAWIENELGNGS